jgi:Protein of unknown function (DUF3040)
MTPREATPVVSVVIDALDPEEQRLWQTMAAVAEQLGDDERWCLVGGLMVAVFAMQAAQTPRVTTDIDVLADARARPSGTTWATRRLEEMGATLAEVDGLDGQRGFRFKLRDQIIDVLAPDGLGKAATTAGKLETIQIPGGTQALKRTEVVEIVVDGVASRMRRPILLGAVLLKARALPVHSRPEDQREDMIALLALADDPHSMRQSITQTERRWLRNIETALALDDPALAARFSVARLRAARAAYQILIA